MSALKGESYSILLISFSVDFFLFEKMCTDKSCTLQVRSQRISTVLL